MNIIPYRFIFLLLPSKPLYCVCVCYKIVVNASATRDKRLPQEEEI